MVAVALTLYQRPGQPQYSAKREEVRIDREAKRIHLRQRKKGDPGAVELFAERAFHNRRWTSTLLTAIQLSVPQTGRPSVEIISNYGRIHDTNSQITLQGQVVLDDPQGYRLMTPLLYYRPQARRASTLAPVQVRTPFGETQALGATLWPRKDRIRFHHRVMTVVWDSPQDAP